jgi:hypothetical protein
VAAGHSGTFIMSFMNGLFNLKGNSGSNSYQAITVSGGCILTGDYDIPNNFMQYLFGYCSNFVGQSGDVFDMSYLRPTYIGDNFLSYLFVNCTNLVN